MMEIHYCKMKTCKDKIKILANACLIKFGLTHLSNDNYLDALSNELESLYN